MEMNNDTDGFFVTYVLRQATSNAANNWWLICLSIFVVCVSLTVAVFSDDYNVSNVREKMSMPAQWASHVILGRPA